nr:hypothetical protein [Tanacetum cinerariifolium]
MEKFHHGLERPLASFWTHKEAEKQGLWSSSSSCWFLPPPAVAPRIDVPLERESGTFTPLCNDIEENVTKHKLDEDVNPHSSLVTVHETNPESEEDTFGSEDTSISIARLETIRLLIAFAAGKGWKIHHLDVKMDFINGNRKKLGSTLKEMGFLQLVQENEVYRKVSNGEFIIAAVYGDNLFVTGASLDLVNKFKRRMASQFEMSDLGELTYYLGNKVSQGKDCIEIKQERYAMKILKEAGMEDCNPTSYSMEKDLKVSKAEDELEVEATQYRKVVGCLRYILHTRPDLTYSVGVVSRYMKSPRESHACAIKQILRYLKVTFSEQSISSMTIKDLLDDSIIQSYLQRSELTKVHQRLEFPQPLSESGCSGTSGCTLRTSIPRYRFQSHHWDDL